MSNIIISLFLSLSIAQDFSGDDAIDADEHITLCEACLTTDNPDLDECVVLDDDGDSDSPNNDISEAQVFNIYITPVNDIPSFTIGDDIETFEDAGMVEIDLWITDFNDGDPEDEQTFTFELSAREILYYISRLLIDILWADVFIK